MKPEKKRADKKTSVKTTETVAAAAGSRRQPAPKPKPAQKRLSVEIPAILLEGDASAAPAAGGPGRRYALGPASPPPHFGEPSEPGELPEAYGTKTLWLTARDPHWLYAHWDLTREQLRRYNALSADRVLVLRVYLDTFAGELLAQIKVHPESRNWFVPVARGGAKYVAELGYIQPDKKWVTISTSQPTLTPQDTVAEDTSARFATIPIEVSFDELLEQVEKAVREHVPLAEAVEQLRASGYGDLPDAGAVVAQRWTPAQARALAQVVSMDTVRRVWIGSLEITELLRRQFARELYSAAAAQFSQPADRSRPVSSISSPYGGVERPGAFWFNVNAELIIYGATEPDAHVTIGQRTIKLRPDGSFGYRFALPDGAYELPVTATSADRVQTRHASLKFSRGTVYRGDVGAHPQDKKLKTPRPEHVA